jgi:CheY-like chemotaxis protein
MGTQDNILIVDDDEGVLTALEAELQDHYEVTAVSSAEQALAQLQTQAYSAIVSDVRMPGVDGLSLISQCAVRYPNMVRVILTAFDGDDVHETALGPHGAFKLVKPWGDDLIITLENALKQRTSNIELRRHLDLKSEMLDIDRRLHTKLNEEGLLREAALEMIRAPEVIAAATYSFDEFSTAHLMETVLAPDDGFVPEIRKSRSAPVPHRDNFLYSVPIGDWARPAAAVALRLSGINNDTIRYLDFVGRQAARTLQIIQMKRKSTLPAVGANEIDSVSINWLLEELTTPVTVLASAPFSFKRIIEILSSQLKAGCGTPETITEFQELTDDITNISSALTNLLNQLRSQKTFIDEARPFFDEA